MIQKKTSGIRPSHTAAVLLLAATAASAQTATPAPGVPLDLARARTQILADLRYELALSVPAAKDHELHHPLRAQASAPLVAPALETLLDVRRHGGTFFDTRWVGGVLYGHSTPAVAETVRQYLASMSPDYPPKLREHVLQASDLLERAARVRRSEHSVAVQ